MNTWEDMVESETFHMWFENWAIPTQDVSIHHLNIIPVRSKTLRAWWCEVNVGSNHRAKVVLKMHCKIHNKQGGGLFSLIST